MLEFLAALRDTAAAIETDGREQAQAALDDLRARWRTLGPEEREATLPLAQLLARRLNAGPEPVPSRLFGGEATPEALLAWFRYESFRPGQREAVAAALAGRDSLVVMPTGGGKTLCYQLPGLASPRLTVVVSPLVALIGDQYRRLRDEGHPAVMLAGGQGEEGNRLALEAVRSGEARIVFAAPERFASRAFLDAIASRELALFVVDEAHCISEWGHDFRPDYLRLKEVIAQLGRPPVMACTATATPEVALEIAGRLGLREPLLVRGGFDRPNISFDVVPLAGKGAVERKRRLLVAGLQAPENRPAIVYCGTRRDVEQVTALLAEAGLGAVAYHAGLGGAERERAQAAFMDGRAEVVVATNAFGMGVDKADVRSVWHWALPTSLEAYYQEAGRAGRDGRPARAVLLSLRADLGRLISFNRQRSITVETVAAEVDRLRGQARDGRVVLDLPLDDDRRLAVAFAERAGALVVHPSAAGRVEVELLGALDRRVVAAACQAARARGWEAYRAIERFSAQEESCHRRQILDHFGDSSPGAPTGRCCSVCDPIDWLPAPREEQRAPAAELSGELAEGLKAWRRERAGERPAFTVCSNAVLAEIVARRPASPEELLEIRGVGEAFVARHADSLLELLSYATSTV